MVWDLVGWCLLFLMSLGAVMSITVFAMFLRCLKEEDDLLNSDESRVVGAPVAEIQYAYYAEGPWYPMTHKPSDANHLGAYMRYRYYGYDWSPTFTCINKVKESKS